MIGAFWDVLLKYGDDIKTKKGIDSPEYKTYSDICERLQVAYDYGDRHKEAVFDFQPKTEADAQMIKFTGLDIFIDPADAGYMYEMDGRHFDTAGEVIDALIADRELHYGRMRNAIIKKVHKWFGLKAESLYTGKPCVALEEYIEGRKQGENKRQAKKKADDK